VGGIAVVVVGPAEQEQPFPVVRRADVVSANATPDRVVPRLGQVAEYTVESAVSPAPGGDVLHDEQRGSS
jgi:hypothetical protein